MNDLMNLLGDINQSSVAEIDDDGFIKFSALTDTDYQPAIPPAGITLRGYQRAAVETIMNFKRGVLGFPPGLGKTPTAITAIANLGGRAVVIIPPSLINDPWLEGFEAWYPNLKIQLLVGRKSSDVRDDTDVVICPDSIISYRKHDILRWEPTVVTVDEAQRHKEPTTKRAMATDEICQSANKNDGVVIVLTGTISTNNATEVWQPAQMAGIAKRMVGSTSQRKWNQRYCYMEDMCVEKNIGPKSSDPKKQKKKKVWIQIPKGCKDPLMLHEDLRATGYIRVEREDIADMPAKLQVKHSMLLDPTAVKEYNLIRSDFEGWVLANGGQDALNRMAGAQKLVQLGKMVEYAALTKIKSCAEYVQALVDQGEQIVVMGFHISVIKAFREALESLGINSVAFTGQESPNQKKNSLDFFKSGEVPVFVGNFKSAGTGLNLEMSANLVFIQLPWSAGDFEQTSDRIYRITQDRTCTIHIPFAANTVEEHVIDVLENKQKITNGINAGVVDGVDDGESFVDEVFELMEGLHGL